MREALLIGALRAAMRLPTPLIRPLGWGPHTDGDHPLSPQLRWFLRLNRLDPRDLRRTSPEQEREAFRRLACSPASGPVLDVQVTTPRSPVPLRTYTPRTPARGPRPLLLWIHGGGWVIGDLETHDRFCRRLCHALDLIVVAVDYRRAPEHPFPAPLEDVTAAWTWVRAHAAALDADPARLLLGGDSAGGNMTAVLCQQLPPEARPWQQILCYPGTDLLGQADSRRRLGDGFFLTDALIRWFLDHYCGPEVDRRDPRISPLRAPVLGADQPPALVLTVGLDPLLDEGRAYAARLAEAGASVEHLHIPAMIHGFVNLYGLLPCAEQAMVALLERLGARLA